MTFFIRLFITLATGLFTAPLWAEDQTDAPDSPAFSQETLTVPLMGPENQEQGQATLTRTAHGVLVHVIAHVPDGLHAFHIHENGDCTPPDFKSAGGHFNPNGTEHGLLNPHGAHAGDMPNLIARNGVAEAEIFLSGHTLHGEHGLFGHSLVIHEHGDDYRSNPAGDAGARIACAELKTTVSH